jgi:predicted transport protein
LILIEGVKYRLKPPSDEKELEETVKEHSKEIFGEEIIYFDLRHKLSSQSGVSSIPDGYVLSLSKPYEWCIVEGELSSHPLHEHITNQLNKFYVGIRNPNTQRELIEALYKEINLSSLRSYVESRIDSPEIKGFLFDLISKPPVIVVVIEELGDKVREACEGLKVGPCVIDFKTFLKEDDSSVHAHLFKPLHSSEEVYKEDKKSRAAEKAWETRKSQVSITVEQHLDKIENVKTRGMATELRDAIKKISDDIEEWTARDYIAFKRRGGRSMFSLIYFQKRGFWLQVAIPRDMFNIRDLDAENNSKVGLISELMKTQA